MPSGKVVYQYVFDVAYEIRTAAIPTLLGQKPQPFEIRTGPAAPRDLPFYRPLAIRLPPQELTTAGAVTPLTRVVKVFDAGIVSISYEAAFRRDGLGQLIEFHEPKVGDSPLDREAERLCGDVVADLGSCLVRPNQGRPPSEPYTVFCLHGLERPAGSVRDWASSNRAEIAALLAEEAEPHWLSGDQVDESHRLSLSYTAGDLVVVDWDAALVVDLESYFDDVLYVIELANVQGEEFRLLDEQLDACLSQAYDDFERYRGIRRLIVTPDRVLRTLRSIRIDVTKMSEEVGNITRFVGDWYLARVYLMCKERFHLGEWEAGIEEKLRNLDELYTMVHTEVTNRRMVLLEVAIVALFIVDVLMLLFLR
ncbi:MAG: hypothetical protein HY716_04115 [Planctomycetes bacterium]|nr:hypothetical protein [Planctomycetota bacterium]